MNKREIKSTEFSVILLIRHTDDELYYKFDILKNYVIAK